MEEPIEVPEDAAERRPNLRGWWDYIPDKAASPAIREASPSKQTLFSKARSKLNTILSHPQNSPPSTHYLREKSEDLQPQEKQLGPAPPPPRGTSPAPTAGSRLGKLVPSIHLFQKVIKDELLYTTLTTATCVVVAVLAVVGLNFKNGLTVTGWIALNCKAA
ncbi:hypothetical protein C0991_000068 [Blastosporella zonata]|nr:hypothetical protein C0991_000068 [Blastosporella zonata]